MANTYGVSYGGRKNPTRFGTSDALSRVMSGGGAQSMQPLSSIRPNGAGFAALNQAAPLDAISRTVQNGQNTFATLTPKPLTTTQAPAVTPVKAAPANFSTVGDPILEQIKALGMRGAQDAASGGLAGAKNDLINYGGTDVPQSLRDLFAAQTPTNDPLLGDLPGNPVLAALNDAQTAQAAGANPFSTRAQLQGAHDTNVHGIDQAANANNLYYSSAHANSLGDENQGYQGAQYQALQSLAGLLSGENNGLLGALDSAHGQYNAELPNAYQRWVNSGGTSDGSTDPTTGNDGTTPPAGDGTTPTTAPGRKITPNQKLAELLAGPRFGPSAFA